MKGIRVSGTKVTHELKSLPHFFSRVVEGSKKFELRKNDRDFQIGDKILLKEWAHKDYYMGMSVRRDEHYSGDVWLGRITYILTHHGLGLELPLAPNYVILGIEKV